MIAYLYFLSWIGGRWLQHSADNEIDTVTELKAITNWN